MAVAALGMKGCATSPEPPELPPEPEQVPHEAPPSAREAPGGEPSESTEPAGEAPGAPASGGAEPPVGEQQAAESAATEGAPAGAEASAATGTGAPAGGAAGELGDRFQQSLGDFDAVLLSEQAKIAEQRRRGVESAPPAGPADRPGGQDPGAGAGAPGTAATGGPAPSGTSGTSPGADEGGSSGGSVGAGSGPGYEVPPDVGTGADDDIVARQLREAAMKEKDPELREKLWDEYRKYKQGTQR